MKKLFIPFLAVLLAFPAIAGEAVTGEHLRGLQQALQTLGYVCDSADEGEVVGRTNRGALVFKVICNKFEFVYRVEVPKNSNDVWVVSNYLD